MRAGSGIWRLGGKVTFLVTFLVALCTASSSSSIHLPHQEPLLSSPAEWGPPRAALPTPPGPHPARPYVFFSEDVSATSS